MRKEDREYYGKRVENAIARLYGEDTEGIVREAIKEGVLEKGYYGREDDTQKEEMIGEIFVFGMLCVVIIIIDIIIYKKQRETAYDILIRKGYSKQFAKEFIGDYPFPRHMWRKVREADMMPFNQDRKSEKEMEYILGETYIFRGFGKEGEPDPKDLTEAVPSDWWVCKNCGKANAPYVGSCGCGCDKSGEMRG